MADNAKTPGTGGNKPKPTGSGDSQSAKDKSRAASRPVDGGGSGRGGNTPRAQGKQGGPADGPKASNRSTLIAWGAVALVVVIIAVLVIVKLTQSSTQNLSYTPVTPAPAQVVQDVSTIPMSTWNKVGVTSEFPVNKPIVLTGQPTMVLNGKSPTMLYYGAEYCPYCAAERWAMVTALSRFGTWSNLKITASSHTDIDAETHTFSFYGASLASPYINFVPIETCTNIPNPSNTACNGYNSLQNPTLAEAKILAKYSTSQFIPNYPSGGGVSFPFVDVDNGMLVSGASYDPQILANMTWTDISGSLSDPTNPVTQVILTTANYITAGICRATKGKPGGVCTSSGVQAAAKSLGITIG